MRKKGILAIGILIVFVISTIVGSVFIIVNIKNRKDEKPVTENSNISNLNGGGGEVSHTHAFNLEPIYEIENEKVYVTYLCGNGCGKRGERSEVSNAVIVKPSTIQDTLDLNVNGKIIVLSAGVYEHIELRPTLANVEKISVDKAGGNDFGEPIYIRNGTNYRDIRNLVEDNEDYNYLYETTIKDLMIVGTEGAVLKNTFEAKSCQVDYRSLLAEDPIRSLKYSEEGYRHTNRLTIENLTLLNLNFNGAGGVIDITYEEDDFDHYNNIKIENCSLETAYISRISGDPAIKLSNAKNVKVNNCRIKGFFKGIEITNAFNFDAINNTIKQTNSNAISMQSSEIDKYFTGNIKIKNNHIEDVLGKAGGNGDRAIYMRTGKHSTVVVEGNTFINAINASMQVLKVLSIEHSLFSFINNNYYENINSSGVSIANIVNSALTEFEIKVK